MTSHEINQYYTYECVSDPGVLHLTPLSWSLGIGLVSMGLFSHQIKIKLNIFHKNTETIYKYIIDTNRRNPVLGYQAV